jgi:oligopeptide transport system permease protein
MLKWLKTTLSKILTLILSVFFINSIAFFLLRLLPGSPFASDRHLAPEIMANLEHKYGLDQPILIQYFNYIKNIILHADFGPSLKYTNRGVSEILFDALPISITLGALALTIALILGISAGVFMATNPKHPFTRVLSMFASSAISLPSFVFAGILISIFGLWLNLLPVALWEGPQYIILPSLTLAIAPTAYILRLTNSALTKTFSQTYIQTAIIKGNSRLNIIFKHAFYNCLVPLLAFIGPLVALLITGSFVVEYIFALPGMGKYFVTAFINRDYFLVSGVIVIFSTLLVSINLLIETINPLLNPKLKTN